MPNSNKTSNSLAGKIEEVTEEPELETPTAIVKVVPRTAPLEEGVSVKRTLYMLGQSPDWTTLKRKGTQGYMKDHSKQDTMDTRATSAIGIKKELD